MSSAKQATANAAEPSPASGTLSTRHVMDRYRADLGSAAPLTREAERELARRYREGDARAGIELVRGCLPFVISIALEYRRWGAPLEDIVQEGNLGLLRAAEKFDPDRDVRLVTYAAYWIRATIRDYVVRAYRLVRLGTTKGERRVLRAYRTTSITDAATLAEVSGLSEEKVERLLPLLSRREASLDDVGVGGEGAPAVSRLASNGPTPEQELASRETTAHSRRRIDEALATLNERERFIVEQRLIAEPPSTLQAVGEQLGVSKERVRQLEERARGKLRNALAEWSEWAEAS